MPLQHMPVYAAVIWKDQTGNLTKGNGNVNDLQGLISVVILP